MERRLVRASPRALSASHSMTSARSAHLNAAFPAASTPPRISLPTTACPSSAAVASPAGSGHSRNSSGAGLIQGLGEGEHDGGYPGGPRVDMLSSPRSIAEHSGGSFSLAPSSHLSGTGVDLDLDLDLDADGPAGEGLSLSGFLAGRGRARQKSSRAVNSDSVAGDARGWMASEGQVGVGGVSSAVAAVARAHLSEPHSTSGAAQSGSGDRRQATTSGSGLIGPLEPASPPRAQGGKGPAGSVDNAQDRGRSSPLPRFTASRASDPHPVQPAQGRGVRAPLRVSFNGVAADEEGHFDRASTSTNGTWGVMPSRQSRAATVARVSFELSSRTDEDGTAGPVPAPRSPGAVNGVGAKQGILRGAALPAAVPAPIDVILKGRAQLPASEEGATGGSVPLAMLQRHQHAAAAPCEEGVPCGCGQHAQGAAGGGLGYDQSHQHQHLSVAAVRAGVSRFPSVAGPGAEAAPQVWSSDQIRSATSGMLLPLPDDETEEEAWAATLAAGGGATNTLHNARSEPLPDFWPHVPPQQRNGGHGTQPLGLLPLVLPSPLRIARDVPPAAAAKLTAASRGTSPGLVDTQGTSASASPQPSAYPLPLYPQSHQASRASGPLLGPSEAASRSSSVFQSQQQQEGDAPLSTLRLLQQAMSSQTNRDVQWVFTLTGNDRAAHGWLGLAAWVGNLLPGGLVVVVFPCSGAACATLHVAAYLRIRIL